MVENQNLQFQTLEDANNYVEAVREHFREGDAQYRGRRNEEQRLIAEVTTEEAREFIDRTMAGILAVMSSGTVEMPKNYDEEVSKAGFSWSDFRNEYERLMVAFGVITNRLNRDGYSVPSYADLRAEDRVKVASVMLTDFLEHNALRFGVDSSGAMAVRRLTKHTDDGGVEHPVIHYDRDTAIGSDIERKKQIERNMIERNYVSRASDEPATHIAGKMSPAEYRQLRLEFPEIDKDKFDQLVGFYTNARKELETKYGS